MSVACGGLASHSGQANGDRGTGELERVGGGHPLLTVLVAQSQETAYVRGGTESCRQSGSGQGNRRRMELPVHRLTKNKQHRHPACTDACHQKNPLTCTA